MLKYIKKNRKYFIFIFLLIFFVFLKTKFVSAELGNITDWVDTGEENSNCGIACAFIFTFLGVIVQGVAWFIGQVSTAFTFILFKVAVYNEFIKNPVVELGWPIVRDICNMFFVLILLIIAFATILRMESYSFKRLLPRLLIIAVLINFSKTICGLLIDFSQVVMLTFANAFATTGAGNLYEALGLGKIFELNDAIDSVKGTVQLNALNLLGSLLLGLVVLIIACIVIFIFTIILVFRIIMFWILIILSPIAFLASAFPGGAKYASQWWSEFVKYLIVGPLIAFFLWLALSTGQFIKIVQVQDTFVGDTNTKVSATLSEIGSSDNLSRFLVTVALLMGGLMMASQLGVAGGGMAGNAVARIKSAGVKTSLLPVKGAKEIGGWGLDKISGWAGIDLNAGRGYRRMQAQMADNKRERAQTIYGKAVETASKGGRLRGGFAHLSTGDLAWRSITSWYKDGMVPVRRAIMGGKWVEQGDEIDRLKEQRKKVWTKQEKSVYVEKLSKDRVKLKDFDRQIEEQEMWAKQAPKEKKEEEFKKLTSLQKNRDYLKDQISTSLNLIKEKGEPDNNKAIRLDDDIKKYTDRMKKFRLEGETEKRVASEEALEREQGKVIASIDNADELGRMFEDALRNRQTGLASAIAKKMTRRGDYNELMGQLKLGTGREGLQEFAHRLENEGGFSRQSALGLVGEMGGIAKNINHFGAFGAVKMENGRWTESSEDDYDGVQLAEMLKLQPQQFARMVNRLGLGEYVGPKHDLDHWRPSRAAIQYIKLNADRLTKQYQDTGQQNAIEHLAANIKVLEDNNVPKELLKVLKDRAGGEVNTFELVKSTKRNT